MFHLILAANLIPKVYHTVRFQIKWMLVIKVTNEFESNELQNAASMKKCKKGQQWGKREIIEEVKVGERSS